MAHIKIAFNHPVRDRSSVEHKASTTRAACRQVCNHALKAMLHAYGMRENGSFALTPVTEFTTLIPKEYILEPDADLERAITGEQLIERLTPRMEQLFDK